MPTSTSGGREMPNPSGRQVPEGSPIRYLSDYELAASSRPLSTCWAGKGGPRVKDRCGV